MAAAESSEFDETVAATSRFFFIPISRQQQKIEKETSIILSGKLFFASTVNKSLQRLRLQQVS